MPALAALVVVLLLGELTASASARPPLGATAKCRDGTYSHSRHHSGTCSYHGGVATWLGGTGLGFAGSVSPITGVLARFGVSVALTRRTRTRNCKLGPNPDRRCSPGAYYSKITRAVICSSQFRTGQIRNVPDSERALVKVEYGLAVRNYYSTLEIDHVIPLELGGSNDIANLFPQRANGHPGYHLKDRLEDRLHAMVCSGAIALRAARRGIAANWQLLYRRVFGQARLR